MLIYLNLHANIQQMLFFLGSWLADCWSKYMPEWVDERFMLMNVNLKFSVCFDF